MANWQIESVEKQALSNTFVFELFNDDLGHASIEATISWYEEKNLAHFNHGYIDKVTGDSPEAKSSATKWFKENLEGIVWDNAIRNA